MVDNLGFGDAVLHVVDGVTDDDGDEHLDGVVEDDCDPAPGEMLPISPEVGCQRFKSFEHVVSEYPLDEMRLEGLRVRRVGCWRGWSTRSSRRGGGCLSCWSRRGCRGCLSRRSRRSCRSCRSCRGGRGGWRCLGLRWSVRLCDQFYVEDEVRLGGDDGRAAGFAVGQLIGDEQTALASDVHALKTCVPSHDDAVCAVGEGDRLAARVIEGGVELGAVGKPAGIADGVVLALFGGCACANFDVDVPERVEGAWGDRLPWECWGAW